MSLTIIHAGFFVAVLGFAILLAGLYRLNFKQGGLGSGCLFLGGYLMMLAAAYLLGTNLP